MLDSALMDVLETIQSRCAEDLDTSTSSILIHTKQQLMMGDAVTQYRTPTTKSGIKTWVIVAYHQVHNAIQSFDHKINKCIITFQVEVEAWAMQKEEAEVCTYSPIFEVHMTKLSPL